MGFRLIGYVVMPEHVHLRFSESPRGTPSTVVHDLKLRTARQLKTQVHNRTWGTQFRYTV